MRATWIVISSICFSMALLWLPSEVAADPTTSKCAKLATILGGGKKGVPKNQSSIDMLKKLAVDCPAIAGSMERLASDIQAYLQKQAEAREHLQQLPIYDPGGLNPMAGAMGPY
jgi:hypothetical protein